MLLMLSLAAVGCGMMANAMLMLGRTRSTFIMTILAGLFYALLNLVLGLSDSNQRPVLFLVIPSLWMIGTAAFGLVRSKHAAKL